MIFCFGVFSWKVSQSIEYLKIVCDLQKLVLDWQSQADTPEFCPPAGGGGGTQTQADVMWALTLIHLLKHLTEHNTNVFKDLFYF